MAGAASRWAAGSLAARIWPADAFSLDSGCRPPPHTPSAQRSGRRCVDPAAEGLGANAIAAQLQATPATIGKCRLRFARLGLEGLGDAPRSGAPGGCGEETERRLLAKLDEPVSRGDAVWTARLLAKQLGDVSTDHVWRAFRKHGIHLQRRRSWRLSTAPGLAAKAADVGPCLSPPENALVICVDEKLSIQALERAQGYLRFSDGQTFRGFSDRYKRHGATTLFGALEVATGMVTTGHYRRRRRIELLDFMNKLVRQYTADQEIHVILDNLRGAIDRFTSVWREDCSPFAWTKEAVQQVTLRRCCSKLCN